MKRQLKRILGAALSLTLLLGLALPSTAAKPELQTAMETSTAYMLRTVQEPQVGSVGGEWAVIGLARSGCDVPQSYWDQYYNTVEDYVEDHKGNLHDKNIQSIPV